MSDFYKIGILGGSFDPVHTGHIHIAKSAASQLSLDKVLLIPVSVSPYSDKTCVASADARMKMLSLALKNEKKLYPSSIEIDSPGISYTIKTILRLKKIYPKAQLYFIIGADAFNKIFSWYKADLLISITNFAVSMRDNINVSACKERVISNGGKVFLLKSNYLPVSSSKIRLWFSDFSVHSSSINKFVHNDVISYILENHIYS